MVWVGHISGLWDGCVASAWTLARNPWRIPGEVTIKVLPGDKIYQAMENWARLYEACCSAWFWNERQATFPIAACRAGAIWVATACGSSVRHSALEPQWLHHNFLPVIGLRVHAKIPPSPLSYQQTVALLGLWERRATLGSQCRALTEAAELSFGLPAFSAPEDWQTKIKDTSLM